MKQKNIVLSFIVILFILAQITLSDQAFAAPGNGTGITIKNTVVGYPPQSAWIFNITELTPAGASASFTTTFTLKANGGDMYQITGLKAGTYSVTEFYKFGYTAEIAVSSTSGASYMVSGYTTTITLVSSEFKTLEFIDYAMPSFTLQSLDQTPPSDLNYNIALLKPVPVQSTWDIDINGNGVIDLVAGKLTTVLVNLAGVLSLSSVSIVFEGNTYTKTAQDIPATGIAAFSVVPNILTPNEAITGYYQAGGVTTNLAPTAVAVKDTSDLPLYYVGLSKSDYGTVDAASLGTMATSSSDFVDATYPVQNTITMTTATPILGASKGTSRDPFKGILTDAMAAAQQAQLYMGGSAVGIAVGPKTTTTDYFTYHGYPGAAGISFGPSIKGVVVLDGFYTAAAHEVAHTFGLYYGIPEEYQQYPPQGLTASGVSSEDGNWRTGYDFMGVAAYQTTAFTWVTTSTFEDLFRQTSINPADPDILLASGIIYRDGTVDTSTLPWYHLKGGIPDTLVPGDYSLNFVSRSGKLLGKTSFDLDFKVDFCPGVNVGSEVDNSLFQNRDTNFAGFSFATELPSGTYKIQIVSNVNPTAPIVLKTVYASSLVEQKTTQTQNSIGQPQLTMPLLIVAVPSLISAYTIWQLSKPRRLQTANW